jgi:hypothetical protein
MLLSYTLTVCNSFISSWGIIGGVVKFFDVIAAILLKVALNTIKQKKQTMFSETHFTLGSGFITSIYVKEFYHSANNAPTRDK